MKIFVETNRFLLRELLEDDVEGMYALDSDPEVHQFLGNSPIQSKDEALAIIKNIRWQYEAKGIGRWAIIDKETNDFVGWTGLKYEEKLREDFSYYDLGYRLRKEYWGKGIATETALASLEYGFNEMNLDEIGAAADVKHAASNKILQKIGLRLVDTFVYDSEPHYWYSLKKTDWAKHPS